ncbi:hypothetical protein HZB69_03555 [Candidatus Amesbacteria bacterium]|nr:hypothetical protein [Candidatus Amesbacteria bacterium]
MQFEPLSERDLLAKGIEIAETIVGWCNLPRDKMHKYFSISDLDYKDTNNVTRKIDELCHNYAVLTLKQHFGEKIHIYGEEARTPASLKNSNLTVALIDAMDGTDLVARGFSNWCTAIIFFHPKQRKILTSIVGHNSGYIYYANSDGAFKKFTKESISKGKSLKRSPDKESLTLEHASVCFYGQKPKNFLSVVDGAGSSFLQKIKEFRETMSDKKKRKGKKLHFRLYNFGGNPMIVKVPERTVDAVFDLSGQKPHDVIPGAYIAMKAGAIFTDLKGKPIDLIEPLLEPHKKLIYILAANHQLKDELIKCIDMP